MKCTEFSLWVAIVIFSLAIMGSQELVWGLGLTKGFKNLKIKNVDLSITGKKDTKQWYFIA